MAAGGEQAGSAYVPIRPDMRGFHREIEQQLRGIIGPILQRIGREAGEEFGRGFGRGSEREQPFEPFQEQQEQQRRRQRREGQDQAGAFAQSFERTLRRASEQLPRIEIDADSSEADRALAELRGRMERLADSKIGVDVSAEDAAAELAEIRAALEAAGEGADVQVRMDLAASLGQISRFQEQIDRLNQEDVEVEVDVDTDEAEDGLRRVDNVTRMLGSSLRGLGAAGRGGLGGLQTGTQAGTQEVLKLGAASAGVFAGMGAGVAGVGLALAGLGVKLALSNEEVKKSFTTVFSEIQKQAVALAKPFIGPLKQIAGIFKSTFAAIAPELGAAFKAIAPALVPLAQGISSMVKSLSALFVPIAQVAAQILAGLGPALAGLGQQLVQFMTPILDVLSQVGAGLFQTLIGGIGQLLVSLGPLLAGLIQVGSVILGPLLAAINVIVGALATALVPLLTAMAPVFVQLVSALAPLIAQLIAGLAPILMALVPILSQIFAVLQPVISALIGALAPVIASLVPVVGLLVGALGQVITALVPLLAPLSQLITGLVTGLLPVLTPIIALIAQTASMIIGALVQALVQCMPALQQVILAVAQLLPLLLPLIPAFAQILLAVIPLLPVVINLAALLIGYLIPPLRLIITVLVAIVTTVLNLLAPVFRFLVTIITWVAGLIQPVLTAIGVGLRWLGTAAMWLWNNAIGPAFRGIATVAKWLFSFIAVVLIAPLIIAFKLISTVVKWLWSTVISPVFRLIGNLIKWVWTTLIRPALNALVNFFRSVIAPVFRWIYNTVIRPLWNAVGTAIRWVWNTFIKPAFNAVRDGVGKLAGYFRTAVSAIGKAWDGLKSAAKKPVKWVVDVVYNNGIVKMWNAVAGLVPGVGKLKPIGFKDGGIYPGYTPGRDIGYVGVSGGEAIMRPEWTRAVGPGFVASANAAARRGGTAGVQSFMSQAGFGGNFALGGIVGGFLKSAKNLFTGGLINTAKKAFNPLLGQAQRAIGGTPFGGLAVGAARGMVGQILKAFKPLEDKIGGDGRKVVKTAEKYVGLSGNPNKFTRRMGMNGLPWCGMFVDGVFDEAQADKALRGVSNPAAVWSFRALPKVSRGAARAGDLGLYRGDTGHINIFTGKGSTTIGGNESNSVRRQSGYINSASSIRRPRFALGGIVPDILAQDRHDNRRRSTPVATQLLRGIAGQPLYDDGGWLPPGISTVANQTRRPEAVLTERQFAAMAGAARVGTVGGNTYVVYPREHTLTEAGLQRMTRRQDALARIGRPG